MKEQRIAAMDLMLEKLAEKFNEPTEQLIQAGGAYQRLISIRNQYIHAA